MKFKSEELKVSIDSALNNGPVAFDALGENVRHVKYLGKLYRFYFSPGKGWDPANYISSEDGADIRLWECLKEEFVPWMLHQVILQAHLRLRMGLDSKRAHEVARDENKRFVEEELGYAKSGEYERYRSWIEETWGKRKP